MVSVVAGNVCLWFPSLVVVWFPSWQGTFFMVSVVGFLMVSGCYRTAAVSPMENREKNTRTFPRRTKYIYIYI